MKSIFDGRIKVVCMMDKMCFAAHRETLKPLSCECYDPYPFDTSDQGEVTVMTYFKWMAKLNATRQPQAPSPGHTLTRKR